MKPAMNIYQICSTVLALIGLGCFGASALLWGAVDKAKAESPATEDGSKIQAQGPVIVFDADAPKEGHMRLVKRVDGLFVIEYYRHYPGWEELGSVPGYADEEKAKRIFESCVAPEKKDEVIIVKPAQPKAK